MTISRAETNWTGRISADEAEVAGVSDLRVVRLDAR